MIDIKFVRENPDVVRESQKRRGEDSKLVDKLLELDTKRRDAIVAFEALRAEQNQLSKSVGAAKGDEKQGLLEKAKELALDFNCESGNIEEIEEIKNSIKEVLFDIAIDFVIIKKPSYT